MAIISTDDVREYLKLSSLSAGASASASAIIDGLVGDLEAYLGRPVTIREFTDTPVLPSKWDGRIRLRRTPVRSIVSFTADGTAVDASYYSLTTWGLTDLAYTSVVGSPIVSPVLVVTYTAGLDGENQEDPFGMVVRGKLLRKAAAVFQKVVEDGAAGAESVSIEGESVRYAAPLDTWTDDELKTLSRFKRRNSG